MSHKPEKLLSIFLFLVALHSICVGIGLIIFPSSLFVALGFEQTFDRFFSTQGGVFHIAMAVCYVMAGYDKIKFKELIIFSIIVKFIATIFLTLYFILISSKWLIIASAASDFLMAIIIYYLYQKLNAESYFIKKQI